MTKKKILRSSVGMSFTPSSLLKVGVVVVSALVACARSRRHPRSSQGSTRKVSSSLVVLTRRVNECKQLAIKEIAALVSKEISSGKDIVNMSQGVPSARIFEDSRRAMTTVIDAGRLPYSAVPGREEVRGVCARFVNKIYFKSRREDFFSSDNIIVTAGGIQACHVCLGLVLETRQDVLLTSLPAYPLYQMEAAYYGATFSATEIENGRATPTPEALRRAFANHRNRGQRVRAVVLCCPNNPTGAAIASLDEARDLAEALQEEIARGGQFIVLLDEVYLGIESNAHVSLLQVASPALAQRICLVLSASKGLGAMPGARAGFVACADRRLVSHMVKLQSCGSGNASTISQEGLRAALDYCMSSPRVLENVRDYYLTRARRVAAGLNTIAEKYGLGPICDAEPTATFYVWANFSQCQSVTSDREIFEKLLECGVAVVPGQAFSMSPDRKLVRFSCAQDKLADLDHALDRIDRAMASWCA